ncbi:MAG: hypothetical protein Q8M56_16910 [Desulfobacterales bacterium]|nr:hypothetical protein [Desulfobacterales bacterium]
MEITDIEKSRKRLFFYICISLSLPVIFGFTIIDFIEGDTLESLINILMAIIFTAGFFGIKKWDADLLVYRSGLALLSAIFLYNVVIGSGNGTAIYWLFAFPLVFMFFLGKKEGVVLTVFFFISLCVMLINPFSFEIYRYNIGVSLRFLVSLLFVTLMAYGLEASREKYLNMVFEKNKILLAEKINLEKALGEIKTLSGLIPICSKCKKIRDDKGFWQQVEVYVQDNSDAEFSHGICPDCFKKLYPGYKYSETK